MICYIYISSIDNIDIINIVLKTTWLCQRSVSQIVYEPSSYTTGFCVDFSVFKGGHCRKGGT